MATAKPFKTVDVTFEKNKKPVTMPGRYYELDNHGSEDFSVSQTYLTGPRGATYCLQVWPGGSWQVYSIRSFHDVASGHDIETEVQMDPREPTEEEISAGGTKWTYPVEDTNTDSILAANAETIQRQRLVAQTAKDFVAMAVSDHLDDIFEGLSRVGVMDSPTTDADVDFGRAVDAAVRDLLKKIGVEVD